jgi:hypothetical protein
VVVTQQPKRSALRMGERLIQGDRPIVAYRRRRAELLAAGRSEEGCAEAALEDEGSAH